MYRRLFLLLLVALLVCLSSAFASVGILNDGSPTGAATNLDIYGGVQSFDGSTLQVGIIGMARGGVSTMVSGTVAIPLGYGVVLKQVYSNIPLTLANGTPGQVLYFGISVFSTGSDPESVRLTPTTKTGFTSIDFNAVGDNVILLYIDDTYGWVLIGSNSVTINQ